MTETATEEMIENVVSKVKEAGLESSISNGEHVVVGLIGDQKAMEKINWSELPGVQETQEIKKSYKLTSREFHPENTVIEIGNLKIGDGSMTMMAGPCSIEGLEQIMECARIAKEGGATVLRGGAFKPRTSPYAFQGLEEEGLKYIREAADAYDMKVITEVMDEANLELVAKYSDILQIGARNMQNFKLLQAVGKTGMPVALKRGISGTIDEWLNAAEYIVTQGNFNVMFVERGIRTYETATRNTLDLSAVPVMKTLTHFPIIVDPSHGVGIREIVPPMAVAGVASGADGLIVEIHPEPEKAWSDGAQSLDEALYANMMKKVHIMEKAMKEINQVD